MKPLVLGLLCAWVLWSETDGYDERGSLRASRWDRVLAATQEAQCRQAVAGEIRRRTEGLRAQGADAREIIMWDRGYALHPPRGSALAVTFHCYPDTVDPRK